MKWAVAGATISAYPQHEEPRLPPTSRPEHEAQMKKPPESGFIKAYLTDGGSGSKQASATCNPLSLAKFITKFQAMGSYSSSSRFTTTHLMLPIVVGMHQGE